MSRKSLTDPIAFKAEAEEFRSRKRSDKRQAYTVDVKAGQIKITKRRSGKSDILTIITPKGHNRQQKTMQLFDFILSQSFDYKAESPKVTFTISDLVNGVGMYEHFSTASHALDKTLDLLTDIKFYLSDENGKHGGKLINHWTKKNGVITLQMDSLINWHMLKELRMHVPGYYYSLDPFSAELLRYICLLGRQGDNRKTVNQKRRKRNAGTDRDKSPIEFRISIRSIADHFYLPREHRKLREKTIYPIERAIENIEMAQSRYYQNMDLSFDLPFPEDEDTPAMSARELMESGYITVRMNGVFKETMQDIDYDADRKAKNAIKKHEKE